MCFSAEVSFTAAAALAVAGIVSLKIAKQRRLLLLALFPLFFSFQQFNEGILWLYLPTQPDSWMVYYSKYVFLFFAYLFWPIWLPLSLTVAEENPTKRMWIVLALIAGIAESAYFLTNPFGTPVTVTIVNHSIQYLPDSGFFRWTYVAIVVIPCFISSVKGLKLFGTVVFLAFAVSEYVYSMNFVSVWCFFAALLSSTICWILWQECKCMKKNCKN